jgi:hypothetical protein
MTEPVDFLIDSDQGQRSITITPINITLTSGILYATKQYALTEGEVGIGTITFDANNDWNFDGLTDTNEDDISHIADFIRAADHISGTQTNDDEPEIISGGGIDEPETPAETITFIIDNHGEPVDVRVEIKYPIYDIWLAGAYTAQLEQDHHSNWFVAQGRLDDEMVQSIGHRIVEYITS